MLPLTRSLTIAYENAVREQKLRTAVSQARRENNHYLQSVDKSKAAAAIVERKTMSGKLVKPVNQVCISLCSDSIVYHW